MSFLWPVAQGIPNRRFRQWTKTPSHCFWPVAQGIPNRRYRQWPKQIISFVGQRHWEFLIGDPASGPNIHLIFVASDAGNSK